MLNPVIEIFTMNIRKNEEYGFIELIGNFDFDYGIQFRPDNFFAFGKEGLTLTRDPNNPNRGTLKITCGNKNAFIAENPHAYLSAQLKDEDELTVRCDGKVFKHTTNFRYYSEPNLVETKPGKEFKVKKYVPHCND